MSLERAAAPLESHRQSSWWSGEPEHARPDPARAHSHPTTLFSADLGILDENEPFVDLSNSKSDVFNEAQQRRNTGDEGDGGSGNASPYVAASLMAESLVNTLSDNEEETVRNIDKEPSPCLSQARTSDQIDIHHHDEFNSYSARSDESARRPRPAKQKRPSSPGDDLMKKRKDQLQTSAHYRKARLGNCRRSERSVTPHNSHSTSRIEHNTKSRLPSPVPSIALTYRTNTAVPLPQKSGREIWF